MEGKGDRPCHNYNDEIPCTLVNKWGSDAAPHPFILYDVVHVPVTMGSIPGTVYIDEYCLCKSTCVP